MIAGQAPAMRRTYLQPVGGPPQHLVQRSCGGAVVQRARPVAEKKPCSRDVALVQRAGAFQALRVPKQAIAPWRQFPVGSGARQRCVRLVAACDQDAQLDGQLVTDEPRCKLIAAKHPFVGALRVTVLATS